MDKLRDIYLTLEDPDSFSTPERLQARTGLKRSLIDKFLRGERSYSIHRRAVRKIRRNRIITSKVDQLWQIDLSDMNAIDFESKRYLLVIIDAFSRFVIAVPLASKKPEGVVNAFQEIFDSTGRKPAVIQSDKGNVHPRRARTHTHKPRYLICRRRISGEGATTVLC